MNVGDAGRRPVRLRSRGLVRIAAGCTVAAAMALAGCQSSGNSPAAGSAGSSITVASVPGVGDAPLYIARQEGLFQQAGLTVRIRSYSSVAGEVAALHSGAATVAVGDYSDFFYAQEHDVHAPMVVVADGYDAGTNIVDVLVRPDSGITSPQDLANKTIGTAPSQLIPHVAGAPPYTLETVAASSVLENDGVQPSSVKWKTMPANELVGALRSRHVDAILVTQPQIYQAESELGAQTVLDACSGETVDLPLDGYFAQASFARQHKDLLDTFRAAMTHAQADAAEPTRLQAALTNYAGMNHQTASLITVGEYPTSVSVTSLQRVADLMSFYGALPRPLDVKPMIFR
jgi:NitT/TauT family transport system substrate-binding protein